MIVVDASAMVEALVGARPDQRLLERLVGDLHAPHLLDVEGASVLRGLGLGGRLAADAADRGRADYSALTINRHEHALIADRVWELRRQFTAHDASYLALAEALRAPVVTCDATLATRGHDAGVVLIALSP